MPLSAVRTFSDPDDYATSIRGGVVEFTVTQRGNFNAKLTRIDLHSLWMQRFYDNLARVAEVSGVTRGRTVITFLANPGTTLVQEGVEIDAAAILRQRPRPKYYQRSSGPTCFATMSLPVELLVAFGGTMADADLPPPADALLIAPPPAALDQLRRLHAAAAHLAEVAPEIITNPDAARGLEQALIEAMIDCLGRGQERESGLAQGQHAVVMRRFRRVVEDNPEEPLYIPEICNAIRVSSRTLQACCHEHLGMAPKRYLLLRRMNLARRALRAAAPGTVSVTDIATRFGFWELGRFAVEYQALFGEPPSAALRCQPDWPRPAFAKTA
jgi:AraC-like DNA-binding protein